ncbi:MAG: hypothetical protein ABIS35_02445 [Terracoccus sp.]
MPHDPTRPDGPDQQDHPVLTDRQNRDQRGDDPPGAFGDGTAPDGGLAPGWAPSDRTRQEAEGLIKELGREHRPRREDVYPYLLIRATSPGDRGARPIWPPAAFYHSPDILLVDAAYSGPFTPTQLVGSPTAGRRYRVFVRVWNLGLLPAAGVHVRAWFVDPGFFGGDAGNPAYQPVLIGGAMVNLDDRTRPGAMAVVEMDRTWDIPTTLTGHECLMASASCPLDQWAGALDGNGDRHVGQRNLTILAGADSAKQLLFTLGQRVTRSGTLEVVHGGGAVRPLLRAVLGTATREFGAAARLRAPAAKAFRRGTPTGTSRHLATMIGTDKGWLVADSDRVWRVALELGLVQAGRQRAGTHPFAEPLGSRAVIERIGPDRVGEIGVVIDAEPGEALLEGLVRLWDLPGLDARDLAAALAEGGPYAHLLQLVHTDREREQVGGYGLTVIG